jgi:nucleoside-diphosphate-sugar epimerase
MANFLRRGLLRQSIEIFGDGRQLRDPVYVDDVVDAFLLAGAASQPKSRLWNVGASDAVSLARIAQIVCETAGAPDPVFRPFPEEHRGIDIGSYCTDSTRIREELGWQPRISLEEGLRRSLEYFRREFRHYLRAEDRDSVPALEAVPVPPA